MYYFGWTILVSVSLWVSLLAFVWALRSGQFAEQGRARYLPLIDELPTRSHDHPTRRSLESYALLGVAILGAMSFLSAIVVSFLQMK